MKASLAHDQVAAITASTGPVADQVNTAGWLQLLTRTARTGNPLTTAATSQLVAAGTLATTDGLELSAVLSVWSAVGRAVLSAASAESAEWSHAGQLLEALGVGSSALATGYGAARDRLVRERAALLGLLLDAVLGDGDEAEALATAARLGVDLAGRRSVIVIGAASEASVLRLLDAAQLAGARDGTTVAIFSGRVPRGAEPAGLGRPGIGIAGIRSSYADAQQALHIARRLGLRGVVPYVDVLAEAVIGQQEDLLTQLVASTLDPLRTTRAGGPEYIETVAMWLQEGLSIAATARALGLHERTIRYRLARIAKLTGLDLQHGDDRFRLDLAIRGERLLATQAQPQRG